MTERFESRALPPYREPLYDEIGVGYDRTRRADPWLAGRMAALIGVKSEGRYLDLACGSGNYTRALAARGGDWRGVDLSTRMLSAARQKGGRWIRARGEMLPFASDTFDGVLCVLAIHHFDTLTGVFSEAARVLDGGRFVILTQTPEQMQHCWLKRYFPDMIRRSQESMSGLARIESALAEGGLGIVEQELYWVREDLQDCFLYAGKHRPEFYLDPEIRAGISSFAALSAADEVEAGLQHLAADIRSGEIQRVIAEGIEAAEAAGTGDYLFVIAEARDRAGD